jgi:hypothetical protein
LYVYNVINDEDMKTYYELRFREDVFDTVYGHTICIGRKGNVYIKFNSLDSVRRFYRRNTPIVGKIHGHGVMSYIYPSQLEVYEIQHITNETPIDLQTILN